MHADYPLSRIQETLTGLTQLLTSCPPEALHRRMPRHSLAEVSAHVAISITHWTARVYQPFTAENEDAIYRQLLGISGWDDNFTSESGVIVRLVGPEIIAIVAKAAANMQGHFTGKDLDQPSTRTLLHMLHHTAYHAGEAATIRRLVSGATA